MDHKTVLIVPATVPDAQVTRLQRSEPEGPIRLRAEPARVPVAEPMPLISGQLSVELLAQLREENDSLRDELDRVRSR